MNNIFAERLKKAMEQKNMKQIDLVKKAAEQGVKLGKSHVSQYLSGKTTPRSEILNFLATTLGVETEWLKGTDVSVDTLKKETNEAGIQMENMKFDYNYNNMKENTRETVEEVQVREFKKSSKLNNVLYDVKKNRKDEMFLAITESKKIVSGEGDDSQVSFEKHKIFLYKEDFEKFTNGLQQAIQFITDEQGPIEPHHSEDMPEEKRTENESEEALSSSEKERIC